MDADAQAQTRAAHIDSELVRAAKEAKVDRRDADEREAIRRQTVQRRDAQRQKTKSPNWGGVLRSTNIKGGTDALPTKSHRGDGALPPGGKDGGAGGAGGGVVGAIVTTTTSMPTPSHSSISPSEAALKSTHKKKPAEGQRVPRARARIARCVSTRAFVRGRGSRARPSTGVVVKEKN